MSYGAQQGPVNSSSSPIKIVDVQISWGTTWISLNDGLRYQVHPDGFGKSQFTKRRKKIVSEFFSGEYTVSETEDNLAQTLAVWIHGPTRMELVENIDFLVKLFSQNPFMIRTRINEVLETQASSGSADIVIDSSHVYMHNNRALATLTYSLLPGYSAELLL